MAWAQALQASEPRLGVTAARHAPVPWACAPEAMAVPCEYPLLSLGGPAPVPVAVLRFFCCIGHVCDDTLKA